MKFYISESTLQESLKLLKLSRKYFFRSFCSKIDELFDDCQMLMKMPFVVRYKMAVESSIQFEFSKSEISILKGASILDSSITPFRPNLIEYYFGQSEMLEIEKLRSTFSVEMVLRVRF